MTENEKKLHRELKSLLAFIKDLETHWPQANCDAYTEELVGGIFASAAGARRTLEAIERQP